VLLTSFEVIGVCYLLDLIIPGFKIEFNAVFVVNVVMCCGLAVEFCVHLVLAFLRAKGTKKERVTFALNNMGSSILIGIGSTKFIGVLVLAFAPSTIFRLYYFRMYFSIIILGLINGVMTLPIILSYIGPPHDPRVTSEEGKGDMEEGLVKYEAAEESKNSNE
jgi:Niemann-Pick C1 protein